jgi:hypothetical protein
MPLDIADFRKSFTSSTTSTSSITLNAADFGLTYGGDVAAPIAKAAAELGGGPGAIWVPPGFYTAAQTIVVPNHVLLLSMLDVDQKYGAVIQQIAGANLDAVIASNQWFNNGTAADDSPGVYGIAVDVNAANQNGGQGIGIAMMAFRPHVRKCCVINARGDGITLRDYNRAGTEMTTGSAGEGVVEDCIVNNAGVANLANNNSGIAVREGVTGGKVTDLWIDRNIVNTVTGHGIYLGQGAGTRVSGCHTYGTGLDAINSPSGNATRIVDNYLEYWGQTASQGSVRGIFAADSGAGIGTVIKGNNIDINGPITGNTMKAISLSNQTSNQAAYFAVGVNSINGRNVSGAIGLEAVNQGNSSNFQIALSPQSMAQVPTRHSVNNFCEFIGAPWQGLQSLSPGAGGTVSIDPSLGTYIQVQLPAGNITMNIPSQLPKGTRFTIVFVQDSVGSRTVTWNNNNLSIAKWQDTSFVPTAAANARSSVEFISDGYNLDRVA